jgi:3-phosphoshikimate 1-carboxyvinyltransferase
MMYWQDVKTGCNASLQNIYLCENVSALICKVSHKTGLVRAHIRPPASKSISNRLLLMSALSGNQMLIKNISDSDDTRVMLKALNSKDPVKDIGHAGTAMRFLSAYYAFIPGEVVLTGSARMKNRPIGELTETLRSLGAGIEYLEKQGYPPVRIIGGNLSGECIEMDSTISSQFISALLMIAPLLKNGLRINLKGKTTSASYITLSLSLMKRAGIRWSWEGNEIIISPGLYNSGTYYVEPDWSSSSYWYAIAALSKNAEIMLEGMESESLQGDASVKEIFENLGVSTTYTSTGALLRKGNLTTGIFNFDFILNPDLVQTVVPVCVSLGVPFYLTGTRTLLIKETNRISALVNEMKKFGASIESDESGEWMRWDGNRTEYCPKPKIETYHDHRMALGIAPMCLKEGEIRINDPGVVSKSYNHFWEDLQKAGFGVSFR